MWRHRDASDYKAGERATLGRRTEERVTAGRESKVRVAPVKQERRPTAIRPDAERRTKTPTHSLNRTLCCGHIPRYRRTASMSVRMS